MAWTTDSLIELQVTLKDSRDDNIVENVFHYRVTNAEASDDDTTRLAFIASWEGVVLTRYMAALPDTAFLHKVAVRQRLATLGLVSEKIYGNTAHVGGVNTTTDPNHNPVQACACIVRKTFRVGRHGIGRTFYGPLHSSNQSNGVIDVAGTGSAENLTTVTDALGDPLTFSSITLKPCVTGRSNPSFNSQCDIRSQTFSDLVTYMKSRRVGVGV